MTGLTLSPLDILLPTHDTVTTIEPTQEGIHPPVPMIKRGVVMRVEVIGGRELRHLERGPDIYKVGWSEGIH